MKEPIKVKLPLEGKEWELVKEAGHEGQLCVKCQYLIFPYYRRKDSQHGHYWRYYKCPECGKKWSRCIWGEEMVKE